MHWSRALIFSQKIKEMLFKTIFQSNKSFASFIHFFVLIIIILEKMRISCIVIASYHASMDFLFASGDKNPHGRSADVG